MKLGRPPRRLGMPLHMPRSVVAASKTILLKVPTKSSPIPCVIQTQRDMERALSAQGFPGGVLVSEADQCRVCRAADLQDGASYTVLPQPPTQRQKVRPTGLPPSARSPRRSAHAGPA